MIRASVANPYQYDLDFAALKTAARTVLEGEGVKEAKVTLAFVDNAHIHRLNKQFLDHDEPTDVLTFPYTDPGAKKLEGEVVIGMEVARENAADRGHARPRLDRGHGGDTHLDTALGDGVEIVDDDPGRDGEPIRQ